MLEIRAASPGHLARIAWHLGNLHLATEVGAGVLRIRPDHVIEEMARGLGAETRVITAPFQPEGEAYGGGHHHHHHPDYDDDHDA